MCAACGKTSPTRYSMGDDSCIVWAQLVRMDSIVRNAEGGVTTSALTLWYSNLPNPDPTVDSDWVQDTTFTTIDLTVAATSYFVNVGNVNAEWVRVKPSVVTSAGTGIYVWVRSEGVEV